MAPKRRSPLEDLPPASPSSSSSSSSEEESEGQKEEEVNDVVEDGESEEDEEDEVVKSPVKKSSVTSLASPKPQSSSEYDSISGSDSESDQTQRSPSASDFTIKPIVSKPMDDSAKPKKPVPKPGAKRAAEKEPSEKESREKKKAKALNGDGEDLTAGNLKGSANPRLWSEDDEIAILKGMIDYQSKKGSDPYADMGVFYEFVKKSLRADVSKSQLMDKIRRLKKKYQTNSDKGENGEDPVFSKPHEIKSFELSKKIWGGGDGGKNVVDDHVKNKKKARSSSNANANANANMVLALPKQDVKMEASNGELKGEKMEASNGELMGEKMESGNGALKGEKMEAVNGELKGKKREDFRSLYPNMIERMEAGQFDDLGKIFVKEQLNLIGGSKAKALEEKWKKLKLDEIELYLKRVELIQEQTKLILDAMKSSATWGCG